MQLDLDNLPSDTVLLHRLVREMDVVVESRTGEIERLQSIIKKLQRAQFGRRSERLDANQLALALEDLDGDVARIRESRPIVIAETDDGRPKRKALPDHLSRENVVLGIAGDICGCCGGALHAIGESSARCWTGYRRSCASYASPARNARAVSATRSCKRRRRNG